MAVDLGLAVVGLDAWGAAVARAAEAQPGVRLAAVCESRRDVLDAFAHADAGILRTPVVERVLVEPTVDAVAVATPHLAAQVLESGRHVVVAQPLGTSAEDARRLIGLAKERRRVLVPAPGRALLDEAGPVGALHYATLTCNSRSSGSASVVRDLAPRQYAAIRRRFGLPAFVRAVGRDAVLPGTLDVVFADLGYPDGALVRVELSWLAPGEASRVVLVGAEGTAVVDAGDGRDRPEADAAAALEGFVAALASDGEDARGAAAEQAVDVVRMIEATEASLLFNGASRPL